LPVPQSRPDFQRYQYAFTAHIRDPKANPRPQGVQARRMRVYSELLFNNLSGMVSACFPVARTVLGQRKWKALLREFFSGHRCTTPYFRQIPEEFLRFMQERPPAAAEPDFLPHLLHYEWVELALEVSGKEPELEHVDTSGDLLAGRPVLNPVHMLLSYPYAVHRIGKRYRPGPDDRQDTALLVFRDLSDRVRFVVLNPVSARLVALLQDGALTGTEAIDRVIAEIRHPDPDVARAGGLQILENLRQEQAVLGTRRKDEGGRMN
jgi:uncharacterized protein